MLSCTARLCSSGGRRFAVIAFSCLSRSLVTFSSPARSWRPRTDAASGNQEETKLKLFGSWAWAQSHGTVPSLHLAVLPEPGLL